jgi:high-affinity iron transporter
MTCFIAAPAPAAEPAGMQQLLHMLDYVGVDYPMAVADGQVRDNAEYQEQQEFSGQIGELIAKLPDSTGKSALQDQAGALATAIDRKADSHTVATLAGAMRTALIKGYDVSIAPRAAPDMQTVTQLYDSQCASCHGAEGYGNGVASVGMDPAPANFRDADWHAQRSVFGLYNSITLGVEGTSMQNYQQLPDAQRWALAFYVSNLAATAEQRKQGAAAWQAGQGDGIFTDLGSLTGESPAEIAAAYGPDAVAMLAYLRADPALVGGDQDSALQYSANTLAASLAAYRNGAADRAHTLAVSAYLEGFELAETGLRIADPSLTTEIEQEMIKFRSLLRNAAPIEQVTAQHAALQTLLTRAGGVLNDTSLTPGMSFASSLIILLREGLEAILVLAAIAAFLIKTGRRDAMKYLHFGWVSALMMGFVTWIVASNVITISGASREMTEGVTALVAAVMLLYVGYWLHNQAHSQAWQKFIRDKISAVLSSRTLWGLALIAFLAVYREVFETVLFYQTLWLQAGPAGHNAILGGFATAAAALILLSWLIFTFSVRLPLKLFFNVNSVLLFVLAVIFAGKGIAALQEAGKLPSSHVNFPSIDLLGIYPNLQGLGVQAALLALAIGWLTYTRLSAREAL